MLTVLTSTVHLLTAVEYMVYITNVLPLTINAIYGNGEHDHNYIFLNQQFINFTYIDAANALKKTIYPLSVPKQT